MIIVIILCVAGVVFVTTAMILIHRRAQKSIDTFDGLQPMFLHKKKDQYSYAQERLGLHEEDKDHDRDAHSRT